MTIGLIYCAWQAADLVPLSLTPWIEAKRARLGGHEFVICAVSVPFESFPQTEQLDDTLHLLRLQHAPREIDHLISGDKPMKETEARGAALRWLISQGCTHSWMVDSDEIYTTDQIAAICGFVTSRPLTPWFRLSLRNAVFNAETYLVEPFTPPRIHKLAMVNLAAFGFWDDNNVLYRSTGGTLVRDIELSHLTVPKQCAWIKHLSWLNDARSKAKIDYQLNGRKWPTCSFAWDETKGLVWNEALPIPETAHD